MNVRREAETLRVMRWKGTGRFPAQAWGREDRVAYRTVLAACARARSWDEVPYKPSALKPP